MDTTSNETAHTLSRRGYIYATGAKKTLENVINNLWDPEDNPDGFVSLGVAENVKSCQIKGRITELTYRMQALMHEELASYVQTSVCSILKISATASIVDSYREDPNSSDARFHLRR